MRTFPTRQIARPLLSALPLLLLLPCLQAAANGSISNIRVFVFTEGPDEGELVNPQTVARHKQALEAVNNLKRELARKVLVVEKKDAADVSVEVLPRGDVSPGTPTPDRDTKASVADLNVAVSSGEFRMNLASAAPEKIASGTAAEDIAGKIENWIQNNRDKLMANRAKTIGAATVTK